jgi:fluoride ion exporter CrcB/FEX
VFGVGTVIVNVVGCTCLSALFFVEEGDTHFFIPGPTTSACALLLDSDIMHRLPANCAT